MTKKLRAIFYRNAVPGNTGAPRTPVGGIWAVGDRAVLITDDPSLRAQWEHMGRDGVKVETSRLEGESLITEAVVVPLSARTISGTLSRLVVGNGTYTLPGEDDWRSMLSAYSAKFPDPPDEEGDEPVATAEAERTEK